MIITLIELKVIIVINIRKLMIISDIEFIINYGIIVA